jgi:chemotaxis protein MotB
MTKERKRLSRQRNQQVEEGAEEWIVTYSDLVTLLLCFFVLLFAFSTVDAEKWKKIVFSFTGEPSVIEVESKTAQSLVNINDENMGMDSAMIENIDEQVSRESIEETNQAGGQDGDEMNFETLYEEIVRYTKEKEIEADVEVLKNEEEIILRFSNSIMFESAKATLSPAVMQTLKEMADLINNYEPLIKTLKIEGNTDSRPIYSLKFKDNYELSMQRALVVLRLFNEEEVCPPEKLVAIGYGEYKPIASNETAEGQAQNRRTDIIIVQDTQEGEAIE